MLYWDYENAECLAAGAIPPESLALPYGKQSRNSPFTSKDYVTIWRAIESGYLTQPGDCPPIRLIANYGFSVRCPGKVFMRRLPERIRLRKFESDRALFGVAEIGGDHWPKSDSGFIASWIAGSEFVKIQTGIRIFFPAEHYLYQGPLPNVVLFQESSLDIMAGIEYAAEKRMTEINGRQYGVANLNTIARLPTVGNTVNLKRGDLLSWFFVVSTKKSLFLKQLDLK